MHVCAHLGLLSGDVARAADAVRKAKVATAHERACDAPLALAHARVAAEIVAVHERQVLQCTPRVQSSELTQCSHCRFGLAISAIAAVVLRFEATLMVHVAERATRAAARTESKRSMAVSLQPVSGIAREESSAFTSLLCIASS